MGFLILLGTWIVPVSLISLWYHTSEPDSSIIESVSPTHIQMTGMYSDKLTFTTAEAEWLAGYVYGCTLAAMGLVPTIAKRTMSKEQQEFLLKTIEEGMSLLGRKSSLQQQGEEELKELLGE